MTSESHAEWIFALIGASIGPLILGVSLMLDGPDGNPTKHMSLFNICSLLGILGGALGQMGYRVTKFLTR